MNSLSSKCKEEANSTDCLLRAIINFLEDTQKESDSKFEWDPITFGFTVSIALLAAGFALITIIQAVLIAGPGRRKSNSEAIGKWSKHTKRKWQLWDLGYLHVAKTPILTVNNVTAHLPQKDPGDSYDYSKSLAASAANWLVFLNEIALSHLELSDMALETWLADYLPSDLLAVPALVELRLVYIYMSVFYKPFRVLRTDSRYPVLMGKDFQFEVRQHPTLGSVATFSRYHKDLLKAFTSRVTSNKLSRIAEQAQGLIPISTAPTSMEGTFENDPLQAEEFIRLMDVDVVNQIDPSYQASRSWLALHRHRPFCTFKEATHKHGQWCDRALTPLSPSSTTLFALMFANIPKAIPEIFPRGKLDFEGVFEALSLSANMNIENWPDPEKERIENEHHLLGLVFSSDVYKRRECPLKSPWRIPNDISTCHCQLIVRTCKRILQECGTASDGIPGIADEELLRFRKNVISMLIVVEHWLRRQCSRRLRCAKFSLSSETIQLQHIAKFLSPNKPLSLGLSLFGFLQWYRKYIESGKDDEFMWRFRDAGLGNPEKFRQLLKALAKSSGIDESLTEDLEKDPSLGGLIPVSAVWPRKPCDGQAVSLGEISLQYYVAYILTGADLGIFTSANGIMDVSREHKLPRLVSS
ncbi:hypothetical protein NW768_010683 [Fusarium equiseti]|uniref:Uncharacterized protein n=1 Tax=Fusarium equiseti TaxID=61235 RepID=A0ABQ8QZW3_FUSEQ|nr:hypothetical protein NW768_010683 [Fusarium equiseti]